MCLLIFAHQMSPGYPLVVAANRDEFNARPTVASTFWTDHPSILAGRDLVHRGTWMGITRTGRFAAVTNYRDPARTAVAPCSRGELPLDFLAGTADPHSYLTAAAQRAQDYAGFNLLVGDSRSLWYFTNSDNTGPRCLPPGIYGLSNASLDTPWPKVVSGKAKLKAVLADGAISHDALQSIVSDRRLADPEALRGHGLDGSMDPLLSAQFIVSEAYGTRSCTTLWMDAQAQISWQEQSFDAQGVLRGVQQQEFQIAAVS
jgi:uncharacterized protein with NRDE domain